MNHTRDPRDTELASGFTVADYESARDSGDRETIAEDIHLRHIQAILGHASIVSTEIYTHMSLEDLKEVVKRAHPHGKRKG